MLRVGEEILVAENGHARQRREPVEEGDDRGDSAFIGPDEAFERLVGEPPPRLVPAAVLQMMVARNRDVAGMAGDQDQLLARIILGIEPDVVGPSHRVAGVGEENSRDIRRGISQRREFQQPALVDPEAPAVEAREHGPDERAPRLRE